MKSLPAKDVSPQQMLQAQQAFAQAQEALVQYQIQQGQKFDSG